MEIFHPSLQLIPERDGEYTLRAITITPNSGFSAGRARPGVAPPTVRLTAEVFPVLLELHAHRGRVRHVPTPVRHRLRDLALGAAGGQERGKSSVLAFVMLGDRVLGSASVPVLPTHEGSSDVDTADWYAWLNTMPGGPPSFHVTGVVHVPTPGYEVKLVPASPQGINPAELILDLQVTQRPGVWPQVVTGLSVRYDQAPASVHYQGVLVREPDGDTVHFDVDIAQ